MKITFIGGGNMAEAIMRAEIGSEVNNLSSKELRRDLLL